MKSCRDCSLYTVTFATQPQPVACAARMGCAMQHFQLLLCFAPVLLLEDASSVQQSHPCSNDLTHFDVARGCQTCIVPWLFAQIYGTSFLPCQQVTSAAPVLYDCISAARPSSTTSSAARKDCGDADCRTHAAIDTDVAGCLLKLGSLHHC